MKQSRAYSCVRICVPVLERYRTLQIVTPSEGAKRQKLLTFYMEAKSFCLFVITNS